MNNRESTKIITMSQPSIVNKASSLLISAGIPVIIITTLLNFGVTIYEKNIDKQNQKESLLLAASLEREKELMLAERKDCTYLVNEAAKLNYQLFDLGKFYNRPFIIKEEEIIQMTDKLFEAYRYNYLIYQRIKAYLTDSEIKKIEAYLKYHGLQDGIATFNFPLKINPKKIASTEDHIGYAHVSDYVIKQIENGNVDDIKSRSFNCAADVFHGLGYFPYFFSKIVYSHVREILNKKI